MISDENIKEVYALVNGQKFPAVYKEETDNWEIVGMAPSESSWSQPDHVFPITLVATDAAGNEVRMTSNDETYGDELKIRVLEKTLPTATIASPTTGSVIGDNSVGVRVEFSDAGGSGLNKTEIVIKVNSVPVNDVEVSGEDGSGSLIATFTASDLSDGQNTIEAYVKDNDGNVSETDTVTFVVSTVAPNLVIESPIEMAITNGTTIDFKGYASTSVADITIESVKISVNNAPEVDVPEDSSAAESTSGHNARGFNYAVTLTIEGENTIVVRATDSAGKTTEVTRHIVLDTKAPIITDVVLDPHVVDASGQFKITFKVVEAEE